MSDDTLDGRRDDARTWVNIVYIGDTVPDLLPFLDSLLVNTTWPLRLVLNGCNQEGHRALERIAAQHPDRLRLRVESTDRILPHGEVLDRLLAIETSQFFCFVDSDILAISPTAFTDLAPTSDEAARWSCLPFWQTLEQAVLPMYKKRLSGPYIRTGHGEPLGGTYAACYRTSLLKAAVETHAVGFGQTRWEQLGAGVQKEFERRQLRMEFYDTAQVISLLVGSDSCPVNFTEIPSLIHVGDWTSRSKRSEKPKSRVGHMVRHRLPAIYQIWAFTWVFTRGMAVREARDEGRFRLRQAEAIGFIEAIEDGTASFEDSPPWLTDRLVFDGLTGLLGRAPSSTQSTAAVIDGDPRPTSH